MPIAVAAPPQPVPIFSGFDYVTIDEARHRAYAAHTASKRLLIVDTTHRHRYRTSRRRADARQRGRSRRPATSSPATAPTNRSRRSTRSTMKVLASVDVPGDIDAIAYDSARGRVYADQDGGGYVYVIDGATMKLIGTITMPADDLESPAVDPKSGVLYQNLANGGGFAIVDPATLRGHHARSRRRSSKTTIRWFSRKAANQVIAGGVNGVLSAYTPDGELVGDAPSPAAHRSMQHRIEGRSDRLRRARHRYRRRTSRAAAAPQVVGAPRHRPCAAFTPPASTNRPATSGSSGPTPRATGFSG